MKRLIGPGCVMGLLLAGCAGSGAVVSAVYEDGNRVVGLQAVSGGHEPAPFSHPAALTEDQVAGVLRGLYVDMGDAPFAGLGRAGAAPRRPVFSKTEIAFFTPLFVRALGRAAPNQAVTFYETAAVSDTHEVTTSGGVFVRGRALYVVLSNHGVRTAIWQDNEDYRPPVRDRPLEPVDPGPGRLMFHPADLMTSPDEDGVPTFAPGPSWRVGVRLRGEPSR